MSWRYAPLALVLALGLLFAVRLAVPGARDDGREVHVSKLVGQPLPALALPPLVPGKPAFIAAADGRPRLVNIFASWCVPCIAEAPVLARMARAGVAIDGIALRDTPAAAAAFLARNGDPYRSIGDDGDSRAQLTLGASGVPESFVVDGRGIIRLHHVGPVMPQDVETVMAALEAAR